MPKARPRLTTLDAPILRGLIGTTFLDRIGNTDPAKAPLRIGSEVWSTHRLATDLGIVHTRAARLLTLAAESIGAKNVRDLYEHSSPYTFAGIRGLGETVMYVLWRVFESRGLDPNRWAVGDATEALVTFHSMKKREQEAEARTLREARKTRRRTARETHETEVKTIVTANRRSTP